MLWDGELVERVVLEKVKRNIYKAVIKWSPTNSETTFVAVVKLEDNYPLFVNNALEYFGCKKSEVLVTKIGGKRKILYKLESPEIERIAYESKDILRKYVMSLLLLGCDVSKCQLIKFGDGCRVINITKLSPDGVNIMMDLTEKMLSIFKNEDVGDYVTQKFRNVNLNRFEAKLKLLRDDVDLDADERHEKLVIRRIENFL